jgi:hypothetical protein
MKILRTFFSSEQKVATVCVIFLMLLIVSFQKKHDDLSPPFTTKLPLVTRDLLPETLLPHITFGFTNLITDIYWIRAVQDFIVWDGKDLYYLNYFKNISALDPTFEYPHLFNILIVPQNKNITVLNSVATIAERGITAIPDSWKIPFYLGTQYYLFTKVYQPAEHYLAIAASRHGAPDGVYLTYSTFVARKVAPSIKSEKDIEFAKSLIAVIYNNTDNETIKKIAEKGLQENLIHQMLTKGIIAYKEQYKRYPKSVDEMTKVHFINLPEELTDNFDIVINAKDGSYTIKEKETN